MGNGRRILALTVASVGITIVALMWMQAPVQTAPETTAVETSEPNPDIPTQVNASPPVQQSTARTPAGPSNNAPAASPRPATWATLTSHDSIPKAIVAFANSPDIDTKAAIVHVAANCMSLASAPTTQQLLSDIQSTLGIKASNRLLSEVQAARSTMLKACDIKALDKVLTEQEIREAVDAAKASPARKLRLDQKSSSPIEYEQSAMVALSNPEKNPLAVDNWLDYGLKRTLPDANELSHVEFLYLRQTLYERLIGPVPNGDFRSTARCALQYSCQPAIDLTPEQRSNLERRALELETLIRQQQWSLLSIR